MGIASINPATGKILKTFEALDAAAIAQRIDRAQQAFESYRQTTFAERSAGLHQAAEILLEHKDDYAKLMTLEMGKPIKGAIAEVEKCAWVCRYYADHGADFLADVPVDTNASRSLVRYQPLGIILAVMPWNYPFWQVFRFAAPALMAGNVGLLKHASNVPQCAIAIETILRQAGFPEGAFQTLLIPGNAVAALMADDRIKAATLTGSEGAGASLAAASATHLKKTVLELGGSDPFIVMPSADLATAIQTGVTARTMNNGQTCIAAKRFILHEAIADEFLEGFVAGFRSLKMGDPLNPDVQVGPLATPSIRDELAEQVQRAIASGATVRVGGDPSQLPTAADPALQQGCFYPPTILTDLPPDRAIAQEELFGPVAMVFRVSSLDDAIALANSTSFGLGASAWTNDPTERDRFLNDLEAGAVFINSLVKSDPRLPFGGIKRSGYGRELSIQGIHEFVNIKTLWVN
jgi:succinate-semialdehyde dehydrogenase / glutarate-semialdehyde dehydrogenase